MKQLGCAIFGNENIGKNIREECARLLLKAYEAENGYVSPETSVKARLIEVGAVDFIGKISVQILVYLGYLERSKHLSDSYKITKKGSNLVKPYVDAKKAQGHLFEK